MDSLTTLFAQHALLTVALGVFLEQLGAPFPSLPILLLAGVQAAGQPWFALQALLGAAAAAMVANTLWFMAGRRLGRRVLTTLCRISISPDTCVRQNEASFAERGVRTLLIAKFVPGLSILAPPLAGALGMSAQAFMFYNLAGSLLWAGVAIAVGWLFHGQIAEVLLALRGLGSAALALAGALLALYVAWRVWRRWRVKRELNRFERIEPAELAAALGGGRPVVVVDVRSNSPELPLPSRIPGAGHLDLGRLDTAQLAQWPLAAEYVAYCACPNDASAVKAALWLQHQGRRARVLRGGIEAWTDAGYPLETA